MRRYSPYAFKPGTWWVDEVGAFHPAGRIDPSFDLPFMRYLHQVKLEASPYRLKISWDVHAAARGGLAAVTDRLHDLTGCMPITLKYCYHGWFEERVTSPKAAADRVWRIQRFRDVKILRPTVLRAQQVSAVSLATPLVKAGFEAWDRTDGDFRRMTNDQLADLLPNALIFRPSPQEDSLVFTWVGSKTESRRILGDAWAATVIGHPSEVPHVPEDEGFNDVINLGIRNVMKTGEPQYEHARTLVTDGEPFWYLYERLLTRVTLHDGAPAVVCIASMTSDIGVQVIDDQPKPQYGGRH